MTEDIEFDPDASPPTGFSRRQTLTFGTVAASVALLGGLTPQTAGATGMAGTAGTGKPFQVLFVLYQNFTLQDFAGANEVLARLPDVNVAVASPAGGTIMSDTRISLTDTVKLSTVQGCDLICVPGGTDRSTMMTPDVQGDLRRLADQAQYVTSICNGSLILGAAGLLKGRRSACHWAQRNLLPQYGAIPDPARVVRDGRYISGGGVTAGIDFALTVAAMLRGPIQAQVIQLLMEYEPDPPFHSGRLETAPPEVIAAFKQRYASLAKIAGLD